jgi:hypothetical protein
MDDTVPMSMSKPSDPSTSDKNKDKSKMSP